MILKLFVVMILLAIISGCIGGENHSNSMEVGTMEKIILSSEAFQEGGAIPAEYTCDGRDGSPLLSWKGAPAHARSIALIMDDPDAPGKTFVHWVIYNIPSSAQRLPKGVSMNATLSDGSRQGKTDFGRIGYGGPCPPPGKPHRYYFKIYAVDTMLNLSPGASKAEVEKAMEGHILAKGELMGRYGR